MMLLRRKRALEAELKIWVEIYALIYDGENSSANSYNICDGVYRLSETKTTMPECNWCSRTIIPGEAAVKFQCPNCGDVEIWRCEKCRLFGRDYKCPKCGNIGP